MLQEGQIVKIERKIHKGYPNPTTKRVYKNFEEKLEEYCHTFRFVGDSYEAYRKNVMELGSILPSHAIGEVLSFDATHFTVRLTKHGARIIEDPDKVRIQCCFIVRDPDTATEIEMISKLHLTT